MDIIKIGYEILKYFKNNLDNEKIDYIDIMPDKLNISENRWTRIIEMLVDNNYLKGIQVVRTLGSRPRILFVSQRLTIDGVKYIESCINNYWV